MTEECLDPELISDIFHGISVVCSNILKLGGHMVISPARVNPVTHIHGYEC